MLEKTRKDLPKEVVKEMKMWRLGERLMPQSYIKFHRDIARTRMDNLTEYYNLTIHAVTTRCDGWMDGMKVEHYVVETDSGELLKLKYNDNNQDFMKQLKSGGAVSISETDLR